MHTFWEIVASNALVVTVMAVAVAVVSRVWRNPAALHLLWLLVLLKLFTPPLVTIGIPVPSNGTTPAPEPFRVDGARAYPPTAPGPLEELAAPAPLRSANAAGEAAVSAAGRPSLPWSTVLAWTWGIGIVLLASARARHVIRFRSALRGAHSPPASLSRASERIAGRLGLERVPDILMLPARLSPLVWSVGGRPRVILPSDLPHRLGPDGLETILVHELAHVRRKDHLVRLLELVVTTLFWWHPVVWWACGRLRELEERCCDAAVLDAVPQGARTYATALVDTLDILSETRVTVPLGATGARPTVPLTRRIEMLSRPYVNRLTARSVLLVALIALVPMAIAFGAEGKQKEEAATTAASAEREEKDGLLGPVQVEILPDAGVRIVRGKKGDVRKVAELIEEVSNEEGGRIGPVQAEILPGARILTLRGKEGDVRKVAELIEEVSNEEDCQIGSVQVESLKGNAIRVVRGKKGDVRKVADRIKEVSNEEGGLSGPVQVEILPDTGILTLRGKKGDVRKAVKLIEEASKADKPAKESEAARAAPNEAARKRHLEIILAEHVILLDQEIVTWPELEEKLRKHAAAGPIRASFCFSSGLHWKLDETAKARLKTAEEWQKRAIKLCKELGVKDYGLTMLSGLAAQRYDAIRTAEDLRPDPSRRHEGTVRLPDGRPAVGATVLVRTQGKLERQLIYLHRGTLRDPITEVCTRTDDRGRFVIHPAKDKFAVAVFHPDGFGTATSERVRGGAPIVLEPFATVELTVRQSPDQRQEAGLAVRAHEVEGSVPMDFYVFVKLAAEPGKPVSVRMPPGPIELHRLIRNRLVSVELVERVGPGETKPMQLGPPTTEHLEKAQEKRHAGYVVPSD